MWARIKATPMTLDQSVNEQLPLAYNPPSIESLRGLHPEKPLMWYDYAELWLNFPLGRVLDYGCGSGDFLQRITDRSDEQWGIDIDPEKVEAAALHGIKTRQVIPDQPLPFEDNYFDTIIIMEVIEHVADERAILAKLERILKPGGRLLLTTPHRGLLTFLDPGNFKFIAPSLHSFVHRKILRQKDYYDENFGGDRRSEKGMIADFTVDQDPWHRHYSYKQIRTLASGNLNTLGWSAYSPAFRALWALELVLKVVTRGKRTQLPRPLQRLSNRLTRRRTTTGDQLVVLFEKKNGAKKSPA